MADLRAGLLVLATMYAAPAIAAPFCAPGASDDTLRPLADSLVGRAKDIFGLAMPDDLVRRTTFMRCMEGKLMLCTEGANLPCGKANLSQSSPGATEFCRENPQAGAVPAFATGHDTIYTWHCENGVARPGNPVQNVDPRGFLTQFWRKVPQ